MILDHANYIKDRPFPNKQPLIKSLKTQDAEPTK